MSEADELLRLVYELAIQESGHCNGENCCQFCGFGPLNRFVSPLHPKEGPHLPSCLWLKIEQYLKERAEYSG